MDLTNNFPLNETDILDELTSIVVRVSDLMKLVATGLCNTADTDEVAKRLRRMDRHKEAEEFQMLVSRARELEWAS